MRCSGLGFCLGAPGGSSLAISTMASTARSRSASSSEILASRSCISRTALAKSCSVWVKVVCSFCSAAVSRTGFSTMTSLTTGTSLIISLGGCATSSRTFFLGFQR